MLLFEAAWGQDRQLSSYPICWLSSVGDMVLDQAGRNFVVQCLLAIAEASEVSVLELLLLV